MENMKKKKKIVKPSEPAKKSKKVPGEILIC